MTTALWRTEFGDEWAVPDVLTNDPELAELSWHNDVCPSFAMARPHRADEDPWLHDVRLWVDHPDPDAREFAGAPRYRVCDAEGNVLFESEEDLAGAIAALKATVATHVSGGDAARG